PDRTRDREGRGRRREGAGGFREGERRASGGEGWVARGQDARRRPGEEARFHAVARADARRPGCGIAVPAGRLCGRAQRSVLHVRRCARSAAAAEAGHLNESQAVSTVSTIPRFAWDHEERKRQWLTRR